MPEVGSSADTWRSVGLGVPADTGLKGRTASARQHWGTMSGRAVVWGERKGSQPFVPVTPSWLPGRQEPWLHRDPHGPATGECGLPGHVGLLRASLRELVCTWVGRVHHSGFGGFPGGGQGLPRHSPRCEMALESGAPQLGPRGSAFLSRGGSWSSSSFTRSLFIPSRSIYYTPPRCQASVPSSLFSSDSFLLLVGVSSTGKRNVPSQSLAGPSLF